MILDIQYQPVGVCVGWVSGISDEKASYKLLVLTDILVSVRHISVSIFSLILF